MSGQEGTVVIVGKVVSLRDRNNSAAITQNGTLDPMVDTPPSGPI